MIFQATLLDITALQQFQGIFPFLLVLVLIYAILARTDMFKEKQGIAALLAFICAIMTLFSRVAIKTINLMAPWFVLFVIFGVLLVLAYMAFGIDQETIFKTITGDEFGGVFGFWVLAIMLIIGLGSLFSVINEEAPLTGLQGDNVTAAQMSQEGGFWQTLFHPKILGMILILLIAFFTISRLTSSG